MSSIHRMRWNDVVDIMLVKAKFIICNSLASACSYFVNEILRNYNPMSNKK
jgi:hypothetical protein